MLKNQIKYESEKLKFRLCSIYPGYSFIIIDRIEWDTDRIYVSKKRMKIYSSLVTSDIVAYWTPQHITFYNKNESFLSVTNEELDNNIPFMVIPVLEEINQGIISSSCEAINTYIINKIFFRKKYLMKDKFNQTIKDDIDVINRLIYMSAKKVELKDKIEYTRILNCWIYYYELLGGLERLVFEGKSDEEITDMFERIKEYINDMIKT